MCTHTRIDVNGIDMNEKRRRWSRGGGTSAPPIPMFLEAPVAIRTGSYGHQTEIRAKMMRKKS